MDEERPVRLPAPSKAVVSAWLADERPSTMEKGGDDSLEGLSPRSSLGTRGRAGSVPYLECLTAPAMQFGGPGEEPQGGSPMQVSSSVAAGLECGCSVLEAVGKTKETQGGGLCSSCLQDHQGKNGRHLSTTSHAEMRSSASSPGQQQKDVFCQQQNGMARPSQPDSAEQELVPAATAYREQLGAHPAEVAVNAQQHASHCPVQQHVAPDAGETASQSHPAAVSECASPAAVIPQLDAPEQPPSTGTSPQHDRKRTKLRMDVACSSRRAGCAVGKATPAGADATANGVALHGDAEAAQRPVRRSFELRLVPATPDVSVCPSPNHSASRRSGYCRACTAMHGRATAGQSQVARPKLRTRQASECKLCCMLHHTSFLAADCRSSTLSSRCTCGIRFRSTTMSLTRSGLSA